MSRIKTIKKHGVITNVIIGWVNVDIPMKWAVKNVELRGTSLKAGDDDFVHSYFDVALDNRCCLHIIKQARSMSFQPYFFENYPF